MIMSEQKSFPKWLVLIFAIVAAPLCITYPGFSFVFSNPAFLILLAFSVLVIIMAGPMKGIITGHQNPGDHFGAGVIAGLVFDLVIVPISSWIIYYNIPCPARAVSTVDCIIMRYGYIAGALFLANLALVTVLLIARRRKTAGGTLTALVSLGWLVIIFFSQV
jgi:hypothetical protein